MGILNDNAMTFQSQAMDMASLMGRWERGDIDLNPPYQRPSVWTVEDQQNLIRSLIIGVPMPAIVINDRSAVRNIPAHEAQWVVIDGKQRMEALIAWFSGELKVPADWFAPTALQEGVGSHVGFHDLSGAARRAMNNIVVAVTLGRIKTVRDEAHAFVVLNSTGVPQKNKDMARARNMSLNMS